MTRPSMRTTPRSRLAGVWDWKAEGAATCPQFSGCVYDISAGGTGRVATDDTTDLTLTYKAWSDSNKVDAWVNEDDGKLYLVGLESTWDPDKTGNQDQPVTIMATATDGGGLESEEFELLKVRVHDLPKEYDNILDFLIFRLHKTLLIRQL